RERQSIGGNGNLTGEFAPCGNTLDGQLLTGSEVCLHQDTDFVAGFICRQLPVRGSDSALETKADHASPSSNVAFFDGTIVRRIERRSHCRVTHVAPLDVVQSPV